MSSFPDRLGRGLNRRTILTKLSDGRLMSRPLDHYARRRRVEARQHVRCRACFFIETDGPRIAFDSLWLPTPAMAGSEETPRSVSPQIRSKCPRCGSMTISPLTVPWYPELEYLVCDACRAVWSIERKPQQG
jgi:hypothetical protein